MRKLIQIASLAAFAAVLAHSTAMAADAAERVSVEIVPDSRALQTIQKQSAALRYLSHLHPDPQALAVIDVAGFEDSGLLDTLQNEMLKVPGIGDILLGTNSHIHELVHKAYLSIPDLRALDDSGEDEYGLLEEAEPVEIPMLLFETDLPKNMLRDMFSGIEPGPKRIESENAVLWVFRDDEDEEYGIAELPNNLVGVSDLPTIQAMSRLAAGMEEKKAVEYGPALQMYLDLHAPEAAAKGKPLIWIGAAHLGKLYPPELAYSGFPYLPHTASMTLMETPNGAYKARINGFWEKEADEPVMSLKYTASVHPKNLVQFLSRILPPSVVTAEGPIDYDQGMAELREAIDELRAFIERNPEMETIDVILDVSVDLGGAAVQMEFSAEMVRELVRSISEEMR